MVPILPRGEPDPIDVSVGLRVRNVRREKGLSQDQVATAIGVTFQQLQKYERGTNRISASMLVRIGKTLGCAPGSLLPSLDDDSTPEVPLHLMQAVAQLRGLEELVEAFSRIKSQAERDELLRLMKLLAERPR